MVACAVGLLSVKEGEETNDAEVHILNPQLKKVEKQPMNMKKNAGTVRDINQISRLVYAFTDNGIKLPVLDITHPQFLSSIDEDRLDEVSKTSFQKMLDLGEMSDTQKKIYHDQLTKSYIYGRVFMRDPADNFLNGMSTYVYKLGPNLIKGSGERDLDRSLSMGIGGLAVRMRIRDLCRMQADVLIPQLESWPDKDLCFVNIAGGAASDSINTLILIVKENLSLLKNRKIEINLLDIDTICPHFAKTSIEALKAQGHYFHGLDIAFNHIPYHWKDTNGLLWLLSDKKETIVMCASEGGLFEYGVDEDIIQNLNVLHDHSPQGTRIAGTIIHDPQKVDVTVPAMAKTTNSGLRFLGVKGLTKLLEKTKWRLESVHEKNPIYVIFTLKKG